MKVLTLHQPWASLISLGVKSIETRSWSTKYRGPLAIHAGAKMPPFDQRHVRGVICTRDAWDLWTVSGPNIRAPLPLGVIVATCTLVDVVPVENLIHESTAPLAESWGYGAYIVDLNAQRPYGDFTAGRFAWLLANVKPVDPPVSFKGGQGLTKSWESAA